MFEYIRGKFISISKDYIVLENNNIGYKIYTSGNTISQMPPVEEMVLLYTEQIVREDFIGLYGFYTKEELEMFKLLITINGVGAKAALSLLSISNVNNLKYGILTGEEKLLTKAPGIGKKIAQRIILELKDKLTCEDLLNEEKIIDGNIVTIDKSRINDALEALMSLGFNEKESNKALDNIDMSNSLEEIIKESLKYLMG
ncbi:Holliday junction branch migration protein RuvA [Clostridium frigidicarnis]|uniref:Holliday junction branch migration complex subunit RuvA n=1 Tax=Clostridium frigidicarnis TaxID=84698 RepID=A0A1I0VLF3_9CLOT|nr:Holliday junction branch migration protein RuvA [Clostridium frigidicarnis]SFA76730.1 Holliday junction DNA helicase subunit RuvA [Clostridium frigidicarnis]